MTADQYLQSLLAKYAVNANGAYAVAQRDIVPVVQQWAGASLLEVRLSGSVAKGTANSGSNDMDLFIALRETAPGTLQDIYATLLNVARHCWPARAQNVSIGIQSGGYHFDLVPGRLQAGYQNWFSLWRNKAQTWTQTNVEQHVQTVSGSGRVDEIRILKLWRTQAGLDFPSFALELAAIQALKGYTHGNLAHNVWAAIGWLGANIEAVRLIDPANTNNVVSDDMTTAEKRSIAQAAHRTRACSSFSEFVS